VPDFSLDSLYELFVHVSILGVIVGPPFMTHDNIP
jgi:hypothetical protein